MGSVPTDGFSVTNLVLTLTSAGSPQLAATLSTPAVQTALQNATTSDLVDLSSEAVQLQEANLLFGDSIGAAGTSATATIPAALDPLTSLLSSLVSTGSSSSGTSSSTASLSNQLAGYQSDLQSGEIQSLFGVGTSGPALSSLFDVLG